MEEGPLASQMCFNSEDDFAESRLKNGSFSPQNGPPCGTTAWYMPYCTSICIALPPQSLWKNTGPHWKRPLDTPAIVLNVRTIVLKRAQKRPFLETKSAVERARRLETARNLFLVMGVCSPVVLSYLDAGGRRNF